MAITTEYLDSISFDIAKQKYYNANKVNAKMEEIKAAVAELMISTQATAEEMLDKARREAEQIVAEARCRAISIEAERSTEGQTSFLGLSQRQLEAIDRLNKQLDDFNVAQATQIFRLKQALVSLATDK